MTLRLHPGATSHSGPALRTTNVIPVLQDRPYRRSMVPPEAQHEREATRRRGRRAGVDHVIRGRRRGRVWLVASAAIGLALATAACGGGSPNAGVANLATTTTTVPAAAAATGSPGSGGTGSGSPGSGRPSSGNTAPGGALVEYARCMRAHGVSSFPEPGSLSAPDAIRNFKGQIVQAVGALASSPVFQAAQRACAEYYGRPAPAPQVSPREMQKLLAVSRCMRAHGVPNFPDPNSTTGDMNPPADISRNSPTVIAALRACQPQARAAGLGPPSTG
jgi:hypothetical protein